MQKSYINIQNAALGYRKNPILQDVTLSINQGDFVGIVGPNGAGKTTLLRSILGILPPLSGQISLAKKPDGTLLRFGYVPQKENIDELFPLSILDIVLMSRFSSRKFYERIQKIDRQIAYDALARVGIEYMANKRYGTLSGGQKQRALIARGLASEPDILILDEPTNGMDLAGEASIMDLVEELHKNNNLTVIFVSHLLNTVMNYAERIIFMQDGRLSVGSSDSILTSETLTSVYGMDFRVKNVDGQNVIVRGVISN